MPGELDVTIDPGPLGLVPCQREILTSRAGALQFLLNRKLNIKPMPRIAFVRDLGAESAAEVERLLKEEH